MPPLFPEDFVSSSTAVALVGSSLYGEQWNGCPTLSEAGSLYYAIAAFREERTTARQRELWPALSASSREMRRRARVLELDAEMAAKQFVSLGDSDIKVIDDEIDAKFAEELARERRSRRAKSRLVELLCSAQVTATLLVSTGNRYEMPCEYWASDQAGSAVDSGKASYNPATYKSGPFGALQGRVLVPKADLMAALERAPDIGAAQSDADEHEPAPKGLTSAARSKGGRKPGSGSYAGKDQPLLELMKPLIAGGKSHWAAAMEVVTQAAGGGTDESKAKRLVARFRESEKTNSV